MSASQADERPVRDSVAEDDDLPLVNRTLAGDALAFEELVRRHEGRVYRTVLALTGNAEDAEEALQDAFLNVYQHLRDFRRDSRFTTWLTRIAINAALHKIRRRHISISLDDPETAQREFVPQRSESWRDNPERLCAAEELRRIVVQAIESLPPTYRVVLVLRDVAELGTVEAAEVLGLTIAALKSRLLRARLMVRETLADRFAKPPGLKSHVLRAAWMVRGVLGGGRVPLPGQKGRR